MARRNKTLSWQTWIDRDDRGLLGTWIKSPPSAALILNRFSPYIQPIVTAGCIPNQQAASVITSKDLEKSECLSFFRQLESQKFWQQLQQQWAEQHEGPWSIPLELSIALHSHKRHRKLNSTPHAETSFVDDLVKTLLDGVEESLIRLSDQDAKLVLSLHFEGLLTEEISLLTNIDTHQVNTLIHLSKTTIKEEIQERWSA